MRSGRKRGLDRPNIQQGSPNEWTGIGRRAAMTRVQTIQNRLHRQRRRFTNLAMSDTADIANVIIRPPIAWALAVLAALALQWLMPLPFTPAAVPACWVGGAVFALALALAVWAIATITRAGSNVPTNMPTTTVVDTGPYRFT